MTLRDTIQRMEPPEAVEHLLYLLEQVSWVNEDAAHPTDVVDCTKSLRRILRALYDANGKTLSYKKLETVLYHDRHPDDDYPLAKSIIRVFVNKLRKNLRGHPWEIKVHYAAGYYLTTKGQTDGRTETSH